MFDPAERPSIASRRADATRAAVVEAAWDLSRTEGLVGWSMRSLASTVGLAAPTLYSYFENKHAIYDVMFEESYRALEGRMVRWSASDEPTRSDLVEAMLDFFDFCTEDADRYQLMFWRVVRDYEPSERAYAASLAAYDAMRAQLASAGVDDAEMDRWSAVMTGLTSQQLTNDPGGDRWRRLVPSTVSLLYDHAGTTPDRGGDP